MHEREAQQSIDQMKGDAGHVKWCRGEADGVADRRVEVRRDLSEARDGGVDRVRERNVELLVSLLPEAGQVVQSRRVEKRVVVDVNIVVESHEAGRENTKVDENPHADDAKEGQQRRRRPWPRYGFRVL